MSQRLIDCLDKTRRGQPPLMDGDKCLRCGHYHFTPVGTSPWARFWERHQTSVSPNVYMQKQTRMRSYV